MQRTLNNSNPEIKAKDLKGSSLKSMGNPIQDMMDISHQEIEEVETNYYERYGTISVGIGFDITMIYLIGGKLEFRLPT